MIAKSDCPAAAPKSGVSAWNAARTGWAASSEGAHREAGASTLLTGPGLPEAPLSFTLGSMCGPRVRITVAGRGAAVLSASTLQGRPRGGQHRHGLGQRCRCGAVPLVRFAGPRGSWIEVARSRCHARAKLGGDRGRLIELSRRAAACQHFALRPTSCRQCAAPTRIPARRRRNRDTGPLAA
jgi:hypothetical protein